MLKGRKEGERGKEGGRRRGGASEGAGKLATVWDKEVVGIRVGLQSALENHKVLIL